MTTINASTTYNSTMITADVVLQTKLISAANAQNEADLASEETYLTAIWNNYKSDMDTWLGTLAAGPEKSYRQANFNAEKTHYDAIYAAAVGYVNTVFGKAHTEALSNLNTLTILTGTTSTGITGFLTNWVTASYSGEQQYVEADRTLSKANVKAAATYLRETAVINKNQARDQAGLDFETRDMKLQVNLNQLKYSDSELAEDWRNHLQDWDPYYNSYRESVVSYRPLEGVWNNLTQSKAEEFPKMREADAAIGQYSSIAQAAIDNKAGAETAAAYARYLSAVWSNEGTCLNTCYATASTLMDSWYNELTQLNALVASATLTANDQLRTAAETADPTGDMIGFLKTVARADVDYSVALVVNLGAYQTGWRDLQLPPVNDPHYQACTDEITRIGNAADARTAYFQALGSAGIDYTDTVLDALGSFNGSAWSAANNYASSLDNAGKNYGDTMLNLENTYAHTMFGAEKAYTLATFSAARAESLGNASAEATGKGTIANASKSAASGAKSVMTTLVSAAGNADFSTAAQNAQSSMNTLSATYSQVVATAKIGINTAKAANKTARESADKTAANAYRKVAESAFTVYNSGAMTALTTYVTAAINAGVSYEGAMKTVGDLYTRTVIAATKKFDNDYCRLTGLYQNAINVINSGANLPGNYWDGSGIIDVQLCFVAGTPVLMADDTTKPIEKIEVGDIVYVKDHENPTGALKKCKVVRVFHNAPSTTYELIFDNEGANESFSLRATPEHPFYVQDKGWVQAELLQPGDVCLSANGTQHVLKTKTFIEEKAPVYNFEVEDAHTYFVGESLEQSVLVHNACPHCGSWWDAWHIFTMCPGKPIGSGELYDAVNDHGINAGSNLVISTVSRHLQGGSFVHEAQHIRGGRICRRRKE